MLSVLGQSVMSTYPFPLPMSYQWENLEHAVATMLGPGCFIDYDADEYGCGIAILYYDGQPVMHSYTPWEIADQVIEMWSFEREQERVQREQRALQHYGLLENNDAAWGGRWAS